MGRSSKRGEHCQRDFSSVKKLEGDLDKSASRGALSAVQLIFVTITYEAHVYHEYLNAFAATNLIARRRVQGETSSD